jgi:hypothetical protein
MRILLLSLCVRCFAGTAEAISPAQGGSEQPVTRPSQVVTVDPNQERQIQDLLNAQSASLDEVGVHLERREYHLAVDKAEEVSRRVWSATGIDPKANLQETIQVNNVLRVTDLATPFSSLSFQQQAAITRAVRAHRSGLLLDLINLAKRSAVYLATAQYFRVVSGRGIEARDIDKLRGDLVRAHNFAFLIEDSNVPGRPMLIRDKDVANENHTYFFNRELMVLATSIKELNFNPNQFDQDLETSWAAQLQRHVAIINADGSIFKRQIDQATQLRLADCNVTLRLRDSRNPFWNGNPFFSYHWLTPTAAAHVCSEVGGSLSDPRIDCMKRMASAKTEYPSALSLCGLSGQD